MIKKIEINQAEYVNFTNYAFGRLRSRQNKNGKGHIKTVILWCVLAFFSMLVFDLTSISLSRFHWQTALVVALPFIMIIALYFHNMRKLQQLCIPNDHGLMLGEKMLEFGIDGITETHPFGHCFYTWASVESVEDNKGDIYIFLDKLFALIIPARSFSSDKEKAEFHSTLKNMCNDSAQHLL